MRPSSSAILLASLLAIAMQGCGLFSSSPSSGPAPALSVVQATDLGPLPTNPDILGRDGGYSALFQGYSLWLYGDTFLAKPNYEDRTLLSDTWSFTTDLNAQDGIPGFRERLDSVGAPTMIPPSKRSTRLTTALSAKRRLAEIAGRFGPPPSSSTLPTTPL